MTPICSVRPNNNSVPQFHVKQGCGMEKLDFGEKIGNRPITETAKDKDIVIIDCLT